MSSKCFERLALQADACGVTRLQAQALLQIRQRTEISVSRAWTRRWAINQIERLRAGVGHAVSDALAGTSTPAACEGRRPSPAATRQNCCRGGAATQERRLARARHGTTA